MFIYTDAYICMHILTHNVYIYVGEERRTDRAQRIRKEEVRKMVAVTIRNRLETNRYIYIYIFICVYACMHVCMCMF